MKAQRQVDIELDDSKPTDIEIVTAKLTDCILITQDGSNYRCQGCGKEAWLDFPIASQTTATWTFSYSTSGTSAWYPTPEAYNLDSEIFWPIYRLLHE